MAREDQQFLEVQNKQIEAGASLIAAVLGLARRRRVALREATTRDGDDADLPADDLVEVDIALANVLMICEEAPRKTARELVEASERYPMTSFSAQGWRDIEDAVDRFVETIGVAYFPGLS